MRVAVGARTLADPLEWVRQFSVLPIIELETLPSVVPPMGAAVSLPAIARNDPIEIVFTSGTTSEPRGVVLTHGTLLANLDTLEKEINRATAARTLFHPLRFLDLCR